MVTSTSNSNELDTFLKEAKKDFLADLKDGKSLENWVVVNGNEAGDLDSLVCAIAYSYFTSQLSSPPKKERYIPLLLTPSNLLALRPENQQVLSSANVPESSLLTISDIPSERIKSLGAAGHVLVDHNRLLPIFDEKSKVVAIVDHHADEKMHIDANPRLIQAVGSCSSLVTSLFEPSIKSALSSSSASASKQSLIPTQLADFLISAILIDTGLKPSPEGKATPVDISSCDFLVPLSSIGNSLIPGGTTLALKALRKSLSDTKTNVGYMSTTQLLQRDYKEYSSASGIKYGISSCPVALSVMLDKGGWDQFLSDVKEYTKTEGLEFEIILTSFEGKLKGEKGKQHLRELFFFINEVPTSSVPIRSIWDRIQDSELKLDDWYEGDKVVKGDESWRVWQQRNAKATRKQVAPIVAAVLAELEKA